MSRRAKFVVGWAIALGVIAYAEICGAILSRTSF
jgi:hypothetical protein